MITHQECRYRVADGIIDIVGNTPLVALRRALPDARFNLFAKLEGFNPGGSAKDRPALNIIRRAIEVGLIDSHTVIIESSSGNMGIGISQCCRYFGLRFICVVDVKTTTQNIAILKAYGAEVDIVTEPDRETGEYLPARLARVKSLLRATPNSYWPNQYANSWNSEAHCSTTMPEVLQALNLQLDYLFCAVSTCGTLTGCAQYIRLHKLSTRVVGVDAVGSVIFNNGKPGRRLIPGHGASIRPGLFDPSLVDEYVYVSDEDCVIGCHHLLRTEAMLAGGSAGAVFMAAQAIRHAIPDNANCVLIFADRGERYLDTLYCPSWLKTHFGENLRLKATAETFS